jgi:hypothetical protein
VKLQPGRVVEGVLVEHATGKVIPAAQLYARPAQYDQRYYVGTHETRTDAAGRFRFETLEPILYRFYSSAVNAAQAAPPWQADPRSQEEIVLSGDVQQGSDLMPIPPPPEDP